MNAPAKQPPREIKPEDQALTMLADPNLIAQIGRALPSHFPVDRMARIAVTELRKTPKLRQCDPYSFIGAVMQCAQLGLEPGSGLGHAYLVPFGKECTMITGYKGKIELMRRSGQVTVINVDVVRRGDHFKYGYRNGEKIFEWEAGQGDAGGLLSRLFKTKKDQEEITHFFARNEFKSGGWQATVMTKAEVDAIRDGLRYSSDVWRDHYVEMGKKTVINRHSKLLPQSPEFVRFQELERAQEQGNQFRMTLQPLIEAGVVDENYDPEPEKQAPMDMPGEKEKRERGRQEIVAEFKDAYGRAKQAGLNLGDAFKLLGMEAEKVEKQPNDEIENATDILLDWIS